MRENKFPVERSKHMKLMDYDKVKRKYLEKVVGSNIKEGNRRLGFVGDKG